VSTAHVATDIENLAFWERDRAERRAAFRSLRETDPVSWHPPAESLLLPPELNTRGFWAITKAAHIQEISRKPDVFSSAEGIFMEDMPEVVIAAALSFIAMDAPEHPQLRGIVHKAFSPGRIRQMEAWIREHTERLVAELAPMGQGEMCRLLTKELPGRIYAQYVGADSDEMRQRVIELADRLVSWNDPEYTQHEEPIEVFANAADGLSDIALELAEKRRTGPGDDMLTWLVQAEFEGRAMEDWEIASFFVMLSGGANDTTGHAIGHALVALEHHPEQKAWLLQDFENRIDGAIDEFLRWNPPIMHFRRTALTDYELAGKQIKRGDKVVLWYHSANFDEDVFEDPERFDLSRKGANKHLAFGGGGPHYCLGSALGRQLLKCSLREVYAQLPDFKVGEPQYMFSNFMNGVRKLPATWSTS
jgi:cytochrome P450